jgi:GTP-binding protein
LRIDSAEFVCAAHRREQFPRGAHPEVAFVGRSNVGKSSLMNKLLGRKGLARTSSTPGRTRSVNYFEINRRYYFVDLPGYGYAKAGFEERQSWAQLVELYLDHAAERLLVVQLVDGKVGATTLDREAYDYLNAFGVGLEVVATKIDRVKRGQRHRALAQVRQMLGLAEATAGPLAVSAHSGEGIKELWKTIDAHLER